VSEPGESEVVLPSLPSGWAWSRVANLGVFGEQTVLTGPFGADLGRDDFVSDEAGAVPVLTIGCLQARGINRDKAMFVDAGKALQMERYRLRHGDIMFSRMATVGRAGLVERKYEGALFNYHLMRLRLEKSIIEPYFFIYFVRGAKVVVDYMRSVNHGMTRDGINTEQLISMPVAVAPRAEQLRVVEAVESYFTRLDDAAATLERVKRNLKRYRASVLKAAVEGRLVPNEAALAKREGRSYEPASVLLERILTERRRRWSESGKKGKYEEPAPPDTTDLPDLPDGWCWASAESICLGIDSGSTPTKEHFSDEATGIPFIKVYNLTFDGSLDFTKQPTFVDVEYEHTKMARSRVEPGDILMNIVGPPLGKVSIVPASYARWNINQAIVCFRPLPGIMREYLSIFLQSDQCKSWLSRTAKTTTSQVNLATTTCRRLAIPLPPLAEQARVVRSGDERVALASMAASQLHASSQRALRLRQSILKWAFEGKLADQDFKDEPASVLLERIKAEREGHATKATGPQRTAKKQVRA
jgi:type I restriction enzyme, S subunit